MAKIVQVIFLFLFLTLLKEKVFAGRLDERLSEELESLLEREDSIYDGQELADYIPPGLLLKKANFWSPHPSDYNPMRRPGTSTSQTPKRSNNPYHPLARTVDQQQKKIEDLLESLKDKRQSPGSYLLLKLGRAKSQTKSSGH